MADDLGIMLTELPEAESISDNDLLYLVKENNSEKVKGLTLKNAVNKIQVPEVISTGDKACYVKRAIPTAGALAEGQKIVGATLAWNQLIDSFIASGTYYGVTVTNATTKISLSGTITTVPDFNQFLLTGDNITFKRDGTKYLCLINATSDISNYEFFIRGFASLRKNGSFIWSNTGGGTWSAGICLYATLNLNVNISNLQINVINLTQLFGSTIADAIYQMEQTTAGSGVAFFRKYFSKDYYDYDAGSLQSVNVSAHKAYDENATEISSIMLDSSKELRGLFNLIDGELRADGDLYEADGTLTRKYGIVDLGSLTWTKTTYNNVVFRSQQLSNIFNPSVSQLCNCISPKYLAGTANDMINTANYDKRISVYNSEIRITDSNYTSESDFKTAMNGVYLVYELATTTTESATPYTNPQIVDADGTEEFVDYKVSQGTRDVAIPVGHESSFYDYTDGTITIPDLPFADGTYALSVTMNNGTPTFSWESNS